MLNDATRSVGPMVACRRGRGRQQPA